MRQILVTPVFSYETIDLRNDAIFNSSYSAVNTVPDSADPKFIVGDNNKHPLSPYDSVEGYVYNKLKSQTRLGTTELIGDHYDKYVRIYFFNNSGGHIEDNVNIYVNGYTSKKTGEICMFYDASLETEIHETLHSLGIPHSFSAFEANENAKFTYEALKTDNIMDYSHILQIPRLSIWNWQGKIAKNKTDAEL